MRIPIGIDLGTTFSAIAMLDDQGRPRTLFNSEGARTTPRVVWIDGQDIVVGKEAWKALASEADKVAVCAKRDIGRRTFHRPVDGREFPPEVIEAFVLNKLRRDAAEQAGAFHSAVITVPAYFDEVRRKATQDAGRMAGIDVLDIINEPTAAAISFAHEQGFLLDEDDSSDAPRTFLVYDLGGGTFDVTVMRVEGAQFITLATDGDAELGGCDWDLRLTDIVAEKFLDEHGEDPREELASAARLVLQCEDAKRTLSTRDKTTVLCDYQGFSSRCEITREELERAAADLVDRTRFTADQTRRVAGFEWDDIDCVLLVGGATRMPCIREMLRELSGKEPSTVLSADESVAHGAALHAGTLLRQSSGEQPAFSVKNVNSHSLGVIGVDPLTKRPRNGTVIPRNTPLPVRAKRTFRTHREGQQAILVRIVEGESPSPEACTHLGKCRVEGLPPGLPAKTGVDVYFHYAANGRLDVRVHVPLLDRDVSTQIVRENGMPEEQIKHWIEHIASM